MVLLSDVVAMVHAWYPPHTAEAWDAVGLAAGHPDQEVRRVLLAVDPAPEVAAEAAAWDADLLLTHHPLFLTPVHSVAATTPKGRTLAALTGARCGLLTAHTNADQAIDGVSEAMASALGLIDQQPLVPAPDAPLDKLTVFVPTDAAAVVRAAMAEAGAGRIGNYDFASFSTPGQGRFRPLEGATPMIGTVGEIATIDEVRIEVVVRRELRARVVAAMRSAHPYEEPAFDVVEMADTGLGATGSGRIGTVPRTSLGAFADLVAEALPDTAHGVRVAGDPSRGVRRVAVCGGAGDFLLDEVARTDADVYVTSDLRHHPAAEFCERGGPALLDVSHWAAEATWLPVVQRRLDTALAGVAGGVETRVSQLATDPWTMRL